MQSNGASGTQASAAPALPRSADALPRSADALGAVPLADALFARVGGNGSVSHPHCAALVAGSGVHATRDLADAIHLLCHLHGRHPGLIDLALGSGGGGNGSVSGAAREWLIDASDHYERERLYLVRLTAAIGPMPSTPGSAESEAALQAQRHAIETLALSERSGCALGAAVGLIVDWGGIRRLLDRAADRAGVERPLCSLPDDAAIACAADAAGDSVAAQRGLLFGGEQLLLQHRGLFDLLEARAGARVD